MVLSGGNLLSVELSWLSFAALFAVLVGRKLLIDSKAGPKQTSTDIFKNKVLVTV